MYGFFLVDLSMWDRNGCDFESKDSACSFFATNLLENWNLLSLTLWWPFHKVISKVTYVHSVSTLVIYSLNFFVCVFVCLCVLCVLCVLTSYAGHRLSYSLSWLKQRSHKWKKQSGNFQVLLWTTFCNGKKVFLLLWYLKDGSTTEYRATRFHTILNTMAKPSIILSLILQKLLTDLHVLTLCGPEFFSC